MTEDKIKEDIKQLKTQKRLLINQVNKVQTEYVNKYKEEEQKMQAKLEKKYNEMESMMKKRHETEMNKLKQKIEKESRRTNRREARNKKKVKKNNTVSVATQTDSEPIIEKNTISTQTEEEKKVNLKTYLMCNDILQNCIDKIYREDMAIQCNLIEEHEIEQIERTTTNQSSNINNDLYILSYFKTIDRKNTRKINQMCYINENLNIRFKRTMLGVLDTDNDIYNISFSSTFMNPINIRFYTEKEFIFSINYLYYTNKQNIFNIVGQKNKNYFKNTFDIDLKSIYTIRMVGNNNKYKIFFNDKFYYEIDLKTEIKYFVSNSNFNIIYN